MMSLRMIALASVSVLSIAAPALAQSQSGGAQSASSGSSVATTNEIVVDARRRSERLQDVPKSIEVVNAGDLQKNAITNFQDIQQLTTGLTLQNSNNGLVVNTEMRGVSFDVNAGANSTVAFYWNDGGAQASYIYQAMYDIGQIEVQKGPQGTLRGAAAPSGAITITTARPDLYRLTGYAEGSVGTDFYGHTVDGALNIPVIQGKLAVRLAGFLGDTDGDGVRAADSATFPINPYNRSWSGRVSVRYLPTDNLDLNFVYQRSVNHTLNYMQTQSTCLFNSAVSCGNPDNGSAYYGVISAKDRLSTVAEPQTISQDYTMINFRADWHVLGQKLSYVGQYAVSHLHTTDQNDRASIFNDYAFNGSIGGVNSGICGAVPAMCASQGNLYQQGFNAYNPVEPSRNQYETHEVRLSSEERIKGIFDYVVGFYSMWSPTDNTLGNYVTGVVPTAMVPGLIANGFTPCIGSSPITAGPLGVSQCGGGELLNYGKRTERAVFGNVTAHLLQDKLEISGGLRYLWDHNTAYFCDTFADGSCTASSMLGKPVTSTATMLNSLGGYADNGVSKLIWTASATYHFTRDIMGYVSGGSSFRQGMNSVGPTASLIQAGGPILPGAGTTGDAQYGQTKNETSTSIEVGIKTQFNHRRGYFNLTYYHQNYKNFQWSAPSFLWAMGNNGSVQYVNGFVASVPVKVDGVEIETGYRFSRELNVGASFSYANGRITGGGVTPGNCSNGAAGLSMALPICAYTGGPSSFTPRWSLSLHGDYTRPITVNQDGYLRVQGTVYPGTPYDPSVPYDQQKPYSIFNVFLGTKAHDGSWDLSVFVKNIFKNQTILSTYGGNALAGTVINVNNPIFSAYSTATITPPRQVGVQLRVSFSQ